MSLKCRLPGCGKDCPLDDIPYCNIEHMNEHIDKRPPPKPYGQVTKRD